MLKKMENVEIRFYDKEFKKSLVVDTSELSDCIAFIIQDKESSKSIFLNKETSIKLVKELKRNIGKLNNLDGNNIF
jgi:hypothetical protein